MASEKHTNIWINECFWLKLNYLCISIFKAWISKTHFRWGKFYSKSVIHVKPKLVFPFSTVVILASLTPLLKAVIDPSFLRFFSSFENYFFWDSPKNLIWILFLVIIKNFSRVRIKQKRENKIIDKCFKIFCHQHFLAETSFSTKQNFRPVLGLENQNHPQKFCQFDITLQKIDIVLNFLLKMSSLSASLCLFSAALCNVAVLDQNLFDQQNSQQQYGNGALLNQASNFLGSFGLGGLNGGQVQGQNRQRPPHQSPCGKKFQYVTDGRQWKGIIKLKNNLHSFSSENII